MELPSDLLEQISFNTRPLIEEDVLIVMDKSTPEEHFSQPLQTNNKHFKIAVAFLTGYKGIFNVKDKNNKFYFTNSITDDGFIHITMARNSYDTEILKTKVNE